MKIHLLLIFFIFFIFSVTIVKGIDVSTSGTFTPMVLSLTVDNPDPDNNSVNIPLGVTLSINCTSQGGYIMNLSWYENTTGSWTLVQQNNSINNGTYRYVFSNCSNYSTEYCWKVSANDTVGNWNNKTFCFTTLANISDIVISDVYPADTSRNIPVQPTLCATVNHTNGSSMSISWYFGTSLGSEDTLLGSDNSIGNITQSELCYLATSRSTVYYWKIVVNDSYGNWCNESFSFTTEHLGIGRKIGGNAVYAVIGMSGIFGLVIFIVYRRRKNEY